jgi:hypothetical protein
MKPVVKHWQDPVNAVLSVWLILAPWALGFLDETAAMANSVAVGLGLLAFALTAMFLPRAWEQWSELNTMATARTAAVATGIVIAVLALWVLLADKDYSGWWRKRTAHQ